MTSLRRSLTLRFTATMLLALAAVATWAYVGVRHTLYEQLDRSLASAAQAQLDVLGAYRAPAGYRGAPDREEFVRRINRVIAARDSAGAIVAMNTELARELPLDPTAFARARAGDTVFVASEWLGASARAIYLPVPASAAGEVRDLQVAASLEPLEARLREVLLRMAATVALGTLATAIGASWLARNSLAPMQEITDQARTVGTDGGAPRITAHANVQECTGLVQVLNEMLARLDQSHEWHRRIVADLGHDLRTPITALRAQLELALFTERSPDEYRRVLASALEEADRLGLISDALVFLGRLESGDVQPNFEPVDVGLLAAEAVNRAQQRAGEHRFSLRRGEPGAMVRGDHRWLAMALDQLLDNAMRYTPGGTNVQVWADGDAAHAELVVEDNGPGVTEALLPHLFERFYRVDAARGRDGGPGLGLTAVAAIVDRHGGSVAAERGSAGGLRVRIQLPRG
jgi:signal transduction histidine kinase